MTVGDFLKNSTRQLTEAGVESARLDCLILLEDALGIDRAQLIAHPELKIAPSTEVELNKKIVQRQGHTPLAYIRGFGEFYGRKFQVTSQVLVPRPETESLIELLLKIQSHPVKIADIGTGSGCLGITAALEISGSKVDLYDISPQALAIARKNAQALKANNVKSYLGDLLSGLKADYDVILANLPYVPDTLPVNKAAKHEPPLALFGGEDGMDLYRTFWQQLSLPSPSLKHIITECLAMQHETNQQLAKQCGYRLESRLGLAQHFIKNED